MNRPRTSPITKIVVHGDVLTDVNKLIAVQKADDRGYHYYIGLDGSIRMVVPPDHIANHIKGANSDSIGIVIAGADNGRMPTAAQDAAAKQLISQLARQYHISPQNVAGHGERQPDRRDVREGGNVAKDIRERGFV
jgi:N-acetyl-anhydromuramyl-L-alanine amidase AmpD